MNPHILTAVAVCLVLVLPGASAAPSPSVYFLGDGDVPVLDGVMIPEVPNATEPKTRAVAVGQENVLPVRFVAIPHEHPGRLSGVLLAGLWLGESTVPNGNLTAVAYAVEGDEWTPIGEASVAIDMDLNNTPDPEAFVPPDPTDPEAVAAHELAQILPLLLRPPALLQMGVIDLEVTNDTQIAIEFRLDQGSSPAPIPAGAFAQVQYDSILSPSFVYVPWFAPDPPAPAPVMTSAAPVVNDTEEPAPPITVGYDGTDEESPAIGFVLAPLLAGFALLRHRLRR